MKHPPLEIAAFVATEHGTIFAAKFTEDAVDAAIEAFAQSNIVRWPDEDDVLYDETPSHKRYHRIAEEIAGLTLALLKRTIGETFIVVASAVLDRERMK